MPRSVPGTSRPTESPVRQASGPSRPQVAIPVQPRPTESPARRTSGLSHPRTSTESSYRPSHHTQVVPSVIHSSKHTVLHRHMDDQRTERHGESSIEVTLPRARTSIIRSPSAESQADDSERVIAALRQEVSALKKAAQDMSTAKERPRKNFHKSEQGKSGASHSAHHEGWAESPSLKEKAVSLAKTSISVRETRREDGRSDKGISERHDRSVLPPPVPKEEEQAELPERFTAPRLEIYNGRTNPVAHIDHYHHRMALWRYKDPLMCRIFPSSLGEVALRWFNQLERGSIGSWSQMAEVFVGRFITNSRRSRGLDTLMVIRLGSNESLKDYSARFWETYNDIDGCAKDTALQAFKLGLPPSTRLRQSLTKCPPTTLKKLMDRVELFVKVEEDGGNTNAVISEVPIPPTHVPPPSSRSQGRMSQAPKASSGPTSYAPPSCKAFQTVFKEPIHRLLDKIKGKPFFMWPSKLIGDPAARGTTSSRSGTQGPAPAGVIHVIHNPSCTSILPTSFRSNMQKASHLRRSYGIVDYAHLVSTSCSGAHVTSAHQVVSFSDEDLADVQMPHNDPLVITLRFGDYDVQRVLVDQGSFAEIMYKGLYEKLGLKEANLANFTTPVFGFTGESTIPMGKTTLPILVGPITLQIEFIVIRGSSPYNAIVGRDWLHRMKAVPSTLHQKLWFPTEDGVMEVNGDQVTVKQCVLASIAQKGTNLSVGDRQEMIALLMEFRDIFAWSVYEAPGVSPDLACHSLSISIEAKLVSQKRRKLAPEQAEIVAKEVERLLEANAIRSVQYPTWLSNTVVVKKKNGKWRVCVDFTDLNRACPKDPFPSSKNRSVGATYQRMVTGMFGHMIGKTVEVYIDDMLIKSKKKMDHIEDLREVLEILRSTKLRLNATKCLFGVGSGKFLGHMVSYSGVEANPDQISALLNLQPPRDAKQVQRLTGMIAALGRFISRSADRCRSFFQLLGKKRKFLWDQKCSDAFEGIKAYLSSPPCLSIPCSGEPLFLYLAVSEHASPGICPSKKAALALIQATKRLPHYFQASTVTVLTDLPLKTLMHSSNFSGQVTRWGVHLGSLGVEYKPRTSIKGQVLADFVAEFQGKRGSSDSTGTSSPHADEGSLGWKLFVDGASNLKGAGAGAVLVSPEGLILRAGYHLQVFCDSQLVVNHISGEYLARDERMLSYLSIAKSLLSKFDSVEVEQIRREYNSHADILAKLATVLDSDLHRTVTVEVLSAPSTLIDIEDRVGGTCTESSWMDPLIAYLRDDCLPKDPKAANVVKRKASRFMKGICGSHTGGRSLAHRAMSQGYWWPYMQSDVVRYVRKCDKCQRFAPKIHQPARELNPLSSPWPFAQWGLDIVGPLPRAPGNKKFLIVATDYFTKWIEAEPLSHIREVDTKRFLWKSIITRFGIPWAVISDNGTSIPRQDICNLTVKLRYQIRTTRRRSIGETPFALAYGVEAVIPLEVGLPTTRTMEFTVEENESSLRNDLNLVEERRDMATIRLASYQHQMKRRYDKNIRPRSFQVGDLVLRKVVANTRNPNDGKLGPNWEGPYKVTSFAGVGAYRLADLNGKLVLRPWNICNLKKYFF
uniref:Integrase catalytic domain-containing protein n=1 Tax=Fagus sylvatica TaxID=28930 RepID=A0A2N9GXW1_FAGSY